MALILAVVSSNTVVGQDLVKLSAEREASGIIQCDSTGPTNKVYLLERSSDLKTWQEHARTHDAIVHFPIRLPDSRETAFFRAVARQKTPDDDWKNQILATIDPFLSQPDSAGGAESRWVKFTIRLDQPGRVYFQDSAKYLFHYSFAVKRLVGFEKLSPTEFDGISLQPTGQQLLLGAVLLPPDPATRELGIQFIGRQPFPVQRIAASRHFAGLGDVTAAG